jgi:hypothetical protein
LTRAATFVGGGELASAALVLVLDPQEDDHGWAPQPAG